MEWKLSESMENFCSLTAQEDLKRGPKQSILKVSDAVDLF